MGRIGGEKKNSIILFKCLRWFFFRWQFFLFQVMVNTQEYSGSIWEKNINLWRKEYISLRSAATTRDVYRHHLSSKIITIIIIILVVIVFFYDDNFNNDWTTWYEMEKKSSRNSFMCIYYLGEESRLIIWLFHVCMYFLGNFSSSSSLWIPYKKNNNISIHHRQILHFKYIYNYVTILELLLYKRKNNFVAKMDLLVISSFIRDMMILIDWLIDSLWL